MATALDIVKRSLRLTGAIASGESLTADEATDGLAALNSMLDSWWLDSLAVYQVGEETLSWPSGQASRTIGSGGDFDTTRPVRIDSAVQVVDGISHPIDPISDRQYRAIADKATSSTLAQRVYCDAGYPLATLYLWPVPSAVADIRLHTWQRIESFATQTETVQLPPGYQRAVEYNLAMDLAPEYERPVSAAVARIAADSLRTLKTANVRVPTMRNEAAHATRGRGGWNWKVG